jgi:NDP-sugar pyrophosphorylase family protein
MIHGAQSPPIPKTAIVLAGGLGTRLQRAVPDRPKVLALAGGHPFLGYVLSYLANQGITDVILSIGYLSEQVRAYAGDGSRCASRGLRVSYCQEEQPLGTGGALCLASEPLSHPFFALNGDTLFLVDLDSLWQAHCASKALATIALYAASDAERGSRGYVRLSKEAGRGTHGRIVAFDEKAFDEASADLVANSQKGKTLVNGGVYVLEKDALGSIKPGERASIERQVFPILAASGQLAGQIQSGYFADIGTPESLARFESDVAAKVIPGLELTN